jgi:hypothetical protein
VIAEAIELDLGVVVLIVLISLGALLGAAAVTGILGVLLGVAIARQSQSPEELAALRRGNRVWIGLAGIAATLAAWIFLFSVGVALVDSAWGLVLVWLGGLALAVWWGWWSGRTYRFSDKADA